MNFKPTKYTHLETAAQLGCMVPAKILLSSDLLAANNYSSLVKSFTATHKSDHYIVRSAVAIEDGEITSHAGYFKTSSPVSAKDLLSTINAVYIENQKRARAVDITAKLSLFVMPYIKAEVGGISLTPWHYFYNHSLVSYATTPGQAVAGDQTKTELLDHSNAGLHPWQQQLASYLVKIHTHYQHPLDIEWAFDGKEVYILQVRRAIISPTYTTTVQTPATFLHNEYAASFGKLSPLSFDLIRNAFKENTLLATTLSVNGAEDFLIRSSNGSLLLDPNLYQRYFGNSNWYSAAKRAFKLALWKYNPPQPSGLIPDAFDWQDCKYAFSCWQIARYLEPESTAVLPHEYELSHPLDPETYTVNTLSDAWKQQYMRELTPLRQSIASNPALSFTTLANLHDVKKHKITYETEVAVSTQGYSVTSAPRPNATDLNIIRGPISGSVCYIQNPDTWLQPLPTKAVIVTPHIPVSWTGMITNVVGVITTTLTPMSHIDITLREKNIPTALCSNKKMKELSNQTFIDLQ